MAKPQPIESDGVFLCPNCGEKLDVEGAEMSCPYCGWPEEDEDEEEEEV